MFTQQPMSLGDERMSGKIKTRAWDSAQHLRDEQDIRHYLEAALEEAPDDAAFMATVLGNVARARNMAELARDTRIARETLYKITRGEGNPTLDTISRLAKSLGFRLTLTPLAAASPVTPVAKQARVVRAVAKKAAGKVKKVSAAVAPARRPARSAARKA
jgi:probable addiction module antidote protein